MTVPHVDVEESAHEAARSCLRGLNSFRICELSGLTLEDELVSPLGFPAAPPNAGSDHARQHAAVTKLNSVGLDELLDPVVLLDPFFLECQHVDA